MTAQRAALGNGYVLAAMLGLALSSPAIAFDLRLVSGLEDPLILGTQASQASAGCGISADGRYVVFQSPAENLVDGDSNGVTDIFVKDRISGSIERINHYADGRQNPAGGFLASISDDARYVSFQTFDRLLEGSGISAMSIYRYDRQNGTYALVSKTATGQPGNSTSSASDISGDGRHIVFYSNATNLVANDTNATSDIFLYNADTNLVTRVSVDAAGVQANGSSSFSARVSDNGNRVAFESDATNLVVGDTNGKRDVFLKTIGSGVVRRVSVDSSGAQALFLDSHLESLSGDGSVVAMTSGAALVSGDSNADVDLFAHTVSSAQTVLVNVSAGGAQADTSTIDGALSVDGRFAVFSSASSMLAGPVPSGYAQVFLKDLGAGGAISFLSYGSDGSAAYPVLNASGTFACYQSRASDITAQDHNDADDIFVVEVATQIPQRISESDAVHPVTVQTRPSRLPDLSDDGAWIVFSSDAFLIEADGAPLFFDLGFEQIYRYEVASGAVERLSHDINGALGNGGSEEPALSGDGRYVTFASLANNLVVGDNNTSLDVFRIDTLSGAISLVTPDGNGHSYTASISDDGARIVFESAATNLIAGDSNSVIDVFLWDAATGIARLSVSTAGAQANDYSGVARLSGDGRFAVFMSYASNLVGNDNNARHDIFLRDIANARTRRISVAEDGSEANADSSAADISGDGRYIVFASEADNLVPNDDAPGNDIFLYDRVQQSLNRISAGLAAIGMHAPDLPRISAGGNYIVFAALDTDDNANLVRYARGSGSLQQLLSAPTSATLPDEYAISEAGDSVVFASVDRLLNPDTNNYLDIYLISGITDSDRIFSNGFE